MYPVNFNYVTTKKIKTVENNVDTEFTVLVIDEARNASYWEFYFNLLEHVMPLAQSSISHWEITPAYVLPALEDILQEQNQGQEEDQIPVLFGFPVEIAMNQGASCNLVLETGQKINVPWP